MYEAKFGQIFDHKKDQAWVRGWTCPAKTAEAEIIDLLSTLARIDDDGCAAIAERANTQMALVEDFVKRELKVSKIDLGATHLAKHTIDVDDHPSIKPKYHVRFPAVMDKTSLRARSTIKVLDFSTIFYPFDRFEN